MTQYTRTDPITGQTDLDDVYLTSSDLLTRFIGQGLYVWGSGASFGSLGLGDLLIYSTPILQSLDTTWKTLADGSSRSGMMAIKQNGTLWGWGINTDGVLGLGDLVHRSSPTQVGSLGNWKSVHAADSTFAVKTDGTLWAWGDNTLGKLGIGDMVHRSSPVQIGSLSNWIQVTGGYSNSSTPFAIKTDGTLWVWGRRLSGSHGFISATDRYSSPVQLGSDTNWAYVTSGESWSLALKTNGSLWGWGKNDGGQLGLGDLVHRSSPVQIGSATTWRGVATGLSNFFGINDGVDL